MKRIDLLLVNPNNKKEMYGNLGPLLSAIEPPMWTGLLAGFIRQQGFSLKIIDAVAENFSAEETAEEIVKYNPLLVGIGTLGANPSASSTPKMAAASRILNILKGRAANIKIFLYGIHPSSLPERTLIEEPVDFVCRGECFYAVYRLLDILKSGRDIRDYKINGLWYRQNGDVMPNGWGDLVKNLDELPFVAWDLLPMDKYRAHNWHCFGSLESRQPYAVIYTSLGCPFNCSYCNIHTLYGDRPQIRFRSIGNVIEEIGLLVENYRIKNIKILDEIFVLKEDRVIAFCDLIIQRRYDLNIWCYARVDTVSERLLRRMKQAGINWICYGIESANRDVRRGIAKGRFDQDTVRRAVKMTHNAGIYVIGNFMFGLPEDNMETMQETLNMAKELNCEYVNFYATMAYPGSRLYRDVLNAGIKLPKSWIGYSQFSEETLPLPTKHLSSSEVLRFRDRAFEDYYHDPKYLKMIAEKFGQDTAEHVKEILNYKIKRK